MRYINLSDCFYLKKKVKFCREQIYLEHYRNIYIQMNEIFTF